MENDELTAAPARLTADRLIGLLYRRDLALARRRSALARTLRLTDTELLALIHLAEQGDLPPSRIAEVLDLSSGGVTAMIQRLERGGHVTRRPHPGDRRSTLVGITPGAARALADADASLIGALRTLSDNLTGEQSATVATFLADLTEAFEDVAEARRRDGARASNALERPVPSLWA